MGLVELEPVEPEPLEPVEPAPLLCCLPRDLVWLVFPVPVPFWPEFEFPDWPLLPAWL